MTEPTFLRADVVQFLHDEALGSYGGMPGIRSQDLLDSALARPVNKFTYVDVSDLFDLAAAYAFGIASNHPFSDGNKRTAWSSCVLFLETNGLELAAAMPEAVEQMVRLASGQLTEDGFAAWLRSLPTSRVQTPV